VRFWQLALSIYKLQTKKDLNNFKTTAQWPGTAPEKERPCAKARVNTLLRPHVSTALLFASSLEHRVSWITVFALFDLK
jgi:hypothetical protein